MGERFWTRITGVYIPKIHGKIVIFFIDWILKMKMMKTVAAVVTTSLTLLAFEAQAALPASVDTSIAAIQTDGQAIFDKVFPVVAVFVGLGIVITLFKRFVSKV
jgi:hypothetical protein